MMSRAIFPYILLAATTLTALPATAQTPEEDAATRAAACAALNPAKSKQRLCEQRTAELSGPLLAQTIAACGLHARSAAGWDACISFASAQPEAQRIESVEACNAASDNESRLRVCIREASALSAPVAPVILACKQAAPSSSLFATCLKLAAPLKESAAPTIITCGERSGSSAKLAGCLRDAAKLAAPSKQDDDPQALFKRVCKRSAKTQGQQQRCVERANALHQPDAPTILSECQLYTTNTEDFDQCLDSAAPLKEGALQRLRTCRHDHALSADFLSCTREPSPAQGR
jgi:hypothetical protein